MKRYNSYEELVGDFYKVAPKYRTKKKLVSILKQSSVDTRSATYLEGFREGILEVLAMFDDYNHPLEFTAEYVREQIIKLLEEENGKQDAR